MSEGKTSTWTVFVHSHLWDWAGRGLRAAVSIDGQIPRVSETDTYNCEYLLLNVRCFSVVHVFFTAIVCFMGRIQNEEVQRHDSY